VYCTMCALGVGTLLPWNLFITERGYFDVRVRVRPTFEALAESFENVIVLVFQML
jgi:solute carrier family 29 (equilibrative nucleoside transporter), member 1/2/3